MFTPPFSFPAFQVKALKFSGLKSAVCKEEEKKNVTSHFLFHLDNGITACKDVMKRLLLNESIFLVFPSPPLYVLGIGNERAPTSEKGPSTPLPLLFVT